MIYGLWLSATGVQTSSHQVDVIANNLANAETSGFKRQLATFRERAPEAREDPAEAGGDRFFDGLGGGQLLSPSAFDVSQGTLEQTDNNLDCAVNGSGYFAVRDAKGNDRLTRNGNFLADREGNLVLATDPATRVLDDQREPIRFEADVASKRIEVGRDGTMRLGQQTLGKLGLFNVADESKLRPVGGTLMKPPASMAIEPYAGQVEAGYLERSNVDPAVELTRLMEAQRTLEANANMIRYQDQTLGRLVNDIGKV